MKQLQSTCFCVNTEQVSFTPTIRMADKQTYKDLWGLRYFYTGSSVGRQAHLWDYAIFTLVFNWQTNINKQTCETVLFLHWCFSWHTSKLVRLCYFYTGASVGRQANLWDCAIFTLVLQLADKCTCEDTATLNRLILQLADKHTCETVSFYTGSSTVSKHTC